MIIATVTGNLGGDAERKTVGHAGDTVTEFSVGSSKKVRDENVTTWVRCQLWGKRGDALAQYLTKGRHVTVVGELSARLYTNKDGATRQSVELRANDIDLGPAPKPRNDEGGEQW